MTDTKTTPSTKSGLSTKTEPSARQPTDKQGDAPWVKPKVVVVPISEAELNFGPGPVDGFTTS